MNNNLDQTIQRTRQYWYVDGLSEIAFGGLCLVLGLYFLAKTNLSPGTSIGFILDAGFVILIVGYGFLAGRLVKAVKTRLTYPRTGYVSYSRSKETRRRTTAIIGVIIGVVLGITFAAAPASLDWIPAINGVLVGGAWLFVAAKIGLPRFYVMAVLSVVFGIGISFAGLGDLLGLAVYYLVFSVIMFISGGYTLYTYLRSTKPTDINAAQDNQWKEVGQ